MGRLPVFCISDIPTATLERLCEGIEDYMSDSHEEPVASEYIVIIDTKDISTITKGSSFDVTSSPTVFLGHTLQEVADWFDTNITQPCLEEFMSNCFLVLDDESPEDDSCIFVCNQDSAPGDIPSLRCTFDIAMCNAIACDIQGESIEEGVMGSYMRSGVTMTKKNLELAMNGGLYMENSYEVKVDQAWRDFRNW